MASDDHTTEIRSYRVCFRLERRIHKIDRWRIPVPYGVPLNGLAYGAAALIAVLFLGALPVTGELLGLLHPWFRYVVIPGLAAWALTRWKIDGRPASAVGIALLRWRTSPRRISAFRPAPPVGPVVLGPITIAPDERSARCRRGVIQGAGRITLRYPFSATERGRTLQVKQEPGAPLWRGKQIRLRRGQRVMIG